jgi:hypothetical protein
MAATVARRISSSALFALDLRDVGAVDARLVACDVFAILFEGTMRSSSPLTSPHTAVTTVLLIA